MKIQGIDHFSICTRNPDRCLKFYTELLGLVPGDRPKLSFPGVWLYADQSPILHVIFERPFTDGPTGAFDHIALAATGSPSEMEGRLRDAGIPFEGRMIERTRTYQIFCRDPDGVAVELNFAGAAA